MAYRTQAPDTSREVEEILFAAYRQMPPWEKVRMVRELNRASVLLALAGLRERNPGASDDELERRLAELRLGTVLVGRLLERAPQTG